MKQTVDTNIIIYLSKIRKCVQTGRDPQRSLAGALTGREADVSALLQMYDKIESGELQPVVTTKTFEELTKVENGRLKYERTAAYLTEKALLQLPQPEIRQEYARQVENLVSAYRGAGLFPREGDTADAQIMAEATLGSENMLVSLTNYDFQSGEGLEAQVNSSALQVVEALAEEMGNGVVTANVKDFINFQVSNSREGGKTAQQVIGEINEREIGENIAPRTPSEFIEDLENGQTAQNTQSNTNSQSTSQDLGDEGMGMDMSGGAGAGSGGANE